MDLEERKYWIAFSSFVGFGPKRFKLLRDYFGSAEKAWKVSEKELEEIGLSEKLIASFLFHRKNFSLEEYLAKINKLGVGIITLEDENYPKLLKQIDDAPFLLYFKTSSLGFVSNTDCSIAVVGTRKITNYGQEVTEKLVTELVFNGITIVSGMARGVDSIAHKTAIENKGTTIAVLGSGIDIIYPPENRTLYNSIVENGAVVSEFPLGFKPMPWCFPVRDRIMSGLSLGVLVTEAASDSGSLITASCAGNQGREVFAVPGPITSTVSFGTSELLKKGAKLVTCVTDILEEIKIKEKKEQANACLVLPANENEKLIIDILGGGQLHINNIVLKSKLSVSQTGSILMMMEMKGMVKNYGKGMYGRK